MEFQQNLLNYISEALITTNETISIAESVTSGLFQLAFSQMPNAGMFYKGGITAYSLAQKVKILNVDENEADLCDCVSESRLQTKNGTKCSFQCVINLFSMS